MLKKWFLSQSVVLVGIINPTNSVTPKFNLLLPQFSFRYYCSTTTTTSQSQSDTNPLPVSYLINNFGFSHESALKAFNQKHVRFNTLEKPNSVITFFKNHGFSQSNIRTIIRKAPWLLSSEPNNKILRKFQFFLSKGVSSSHIVSLLTANPKILQSSLEKRIIPRFELLSKFLKTNKDVIVCLILHWSLFVRTPYDNIVANINLMTDFGVCDSNIARLLQQRPSIFSSTDLLKSLEEVKGLGFDPSMTTFEAALMAKKCMTKKLWNQKVDVFKKWGWSDEVVLQAFRSYPCLMLVSIDKVNLVMRYWVNQLGWNSLALIKCPLIFGFSLEKRVIPRASILQFLLMKGLRKKNSSLVAPFLYTEKLFLDKFVFSFKEESDYLLKLYQEKMELAYTKENNGMPLTI
jgi:mTERF domain-containing protein